MSKSAALRSDWTAYAEKNGLIEDAPSAAPKGNKYGARRVQEAGIWFDSKKEAARFHELTLMQVAGQIADLELQPEFPLHVMCLYRSQMPIRIVTIGTFHADFRYIDQRTGEIVIEDVKSEFTKNTAYKLRKVIAESVHGVVITEV